MDDRPGPLFRLTDLLLCAVIALAGCGAVGGDDDAGAGTGADATATTGSASGADDARDAGEGAYPVTIEHSTGTTTIEQRPERIVTLNVQWTDAVLAMGEEPVAFVLDSAAMERKPYPWQEGLLDGVEVIETAGTIPFEQIAALEPDLILATYLVTDPGEVETLQQIAPTIPALSDVVDQWQDHLEVLGQILGEPERADEVVRDVEGRIASLAAELPGLQGKTYVAANYIQGDGIYVVADPEDGAARLFYGLGMEITPTVLELDGTDFGRVRISPEQTSLLDADFVGLLSNGSDPSVLPGWDQLPAVRGGGLVDFEYADVVGLNTPSALSLPYVMDLIRPTLEAVAAS